MENKIKVIKEIVKFHPAMGTEKGYSWYQGGIRDTGDWYWDKMVDIPTEELETFLKELKEAQRLGTESREIEKKLRETLGEDEYYRRMMIVQQNIRIDLGKYEEQQLMWGSTMNEKLHCKDYNDYPESYWNK